MVGDVCIFLFKLYIKIEIGLRFIKNIFIFIYNLIKHVIKNIPKYLYNLVKIILVKINLIKINLWKFFIDIPIKRIKGLYIIICNIFLVFFKNLKLTIVYMKSIILNFLYKINGFIIIVINKVKKFCEVMVYFLNLIKFNILNFINYVKHAILTFFKCLNYIWISLINLINYIYISLINFINYIKHMIMTFFKFLNYMRISLINFINYIKYIIITFFKKHFFFTIKRRQKVSFVGSVFIIIIATIIWFLVFTAHVFPEYFYELEDYFYNFLCQCLEIVAFSIFCIKLFIVEIFKLLINGLYFLNDYIKIDIDELVVKLETYRVWIELKFNKIIWLLFIEKLIKINLITVAFYGIMFWVYFLVIYILYEIEKPTVLGYIFVILIFISFMSWIIYLI